MSVCRVRILTGAGLVLAAFAFVACAAPTEDSDQSSEAIRTVRPPIVGGGGGQVTLPPIATVTAPQPVVSMPFVYSTRYDAELHGNHACASVDAPTGEWVASYTFDASVPTLCSYTWFAQSGVPSDDATLSASVGPISLWLRYDASCSGASCVPVATDTDYAGGGVEGSVACSSCTVIGLTSSGIAHIVLPPAHVTAYPQTLPVLSGFGAITLLVDVPANAQVLSVPVTLPSTPGAKPTLLQLDDATHDPPPPRPKD